MTLEVRNGIRFSERTTLRLGGTSLAEVVLRSPVDCDALPSTLNQLGGAPLILGWGSNILAHDGELPLVVVTPAINDAPEVLLENAGGVYVRVGAGFRLPRLLGWLCANGLDGLTGLSGIPGTIGGAVAMNAGSYGCETAESLHSVTVFSPETGLTECGKEQFDARYRHFGLKGIRGWFVVLAATYRVSRGNRNQIHAQMRENYLKKKATQPVTAYSAGCVFKNPEGVSAGRLLDEAGFKGKMLGGMGFSSMHANFLINTGNGTSADALELLDMAEEAVKQRSGFTLQREVKVVWR